MAIFHESFTYQLAAPSDSANNSFLTNNYYKGTIYSTEWIGDSVKAGKLLDKQKYKLTEIKDGKELEFAKGKLQYTIREVIIIYDWIKDK